MMRKTMTLLLASALLCAVGARAQAPSSNPEQPQSPERKPAPKTKDQMKTAWENGVKADCAAEIASGGVCGGKDFGTGLEKCLHKNRKKLSDGCKAAVHPHKKMKKGATGAKGGTQEAPASAPQAPTTTPQP